MLGNRVKKVLTKYLENPKDEASIKELMNKVEQSRFVTEKELYSLKCLTDLIGWQPLTDSENQRLRELPSIRNKTEFLFQLNELQWKVTGRLIDQYGNLSDVSYHDIRH